MKPCPKCKSHRLRIGLEKNGQVDGHTVIEVLVSCRACTFWFRLAEGQAIDALLPIYARGEAVQ